MALALGYANVDQMIRDMEPGQFNEWRMFFRLEPWGEERADLRTASIEAALWNLHRDRKVHPKGFLRSEFLTGLGDMLASTMSAPVVQDAKTMERHLDTWCWTNNAVIAATAAKRGN